MKYRSLAALSIGLLSATLPVVTAAAVTTQNVLPGRFFGKKVATLKDQLEKGLMARQPSEFEFIGRVVQMVDEDQLSAELVRSTFNWARRKRPYPFPYFERALKIRAARQGIRIQ